MPADDEVLDTGPDEEEGVEEAGPAPDEEDPAAAGSPAAAPDLPPDIEAEINRVLVPEEPPAAKSKAQFIPEDLINRPLAPEDFFDEDRI